jgi:hypothetical protein
MYTYNQLWTEAGFNNENAHQQQQQQTAKLIIISQLCFALLLQE